MRINFITLGCSKNLTDSETIATYIRKNNINVVFEQPALKDDIIIINTCGFIYDAKQESIDTILQFTEAKKQGLVKKVYVTGCLSQRYKKELADEIPEADGFFGVNIYEILQELKIDYKKELYGERLISTPSHYAYLKISEGCNRKCSFCAIPLIRGKHISVPFEEIIRQAQYLTKNGVKELILIAQDTSYYGIDLYGKYRFAELLEELALNSGAEWIRVHYLYPVPFIDEILDVMSRHKNICKYVDIPFQHISDKILQSMRRGHNGDFIYKTIEKIRYYLPLAALRSTLITGYPGETEKDFEQLTDFVRNVRFDRLGVFTYSNEENTYAYTLGDNIPQEVKNERQEILMSIQQKISEELNKEKIDKVFRTLIDRIEGDFYIGRTELDSPEVDNEVLIKKDKKLQIGNFYNIKITEADEYDLYGSPLKV